MRHPSKPAAPSQARTAAPQRVLPSGLSWTCRCPDRAKEKTPAVQAGQTHAAPIRNAGGMGEEKHLRSLLGGEFGPDQVPVGRAKVFPRELPAALFLNASTVGNWNSLLAPFVDRCPAQAKSASKRDLEAAPLKKNIPVVHAVSMASPNSHVKPLIRLIRNEEFLSYSIVAQTCIKERDNITTLSKFIV